MALFGKTDGELRDLGFSIEREHAKKLGVLKEFDRYAAEGRLSEFQPQLNYLKLKQESKEQRKAERILFLIYGVIIGFLAAYLIFSYEIGFGYIGCAIIAAIFLYASILTFRDTYKISLKSGHGTLSCLMRASVSFFLPSLGIIFFLLLVAIIIRTKESLGLFERILVVLLGAIVPTLILALLAVWIYDKKSQIKP
jgi:uncharacterized membrane protein YeaQ/YmgE (transglycosylase-associated protein family)